MSNGSRGSYRTTRENVMRAFDNLPPAARIALANALDNWVAQPFLTMQRRESRSGEYIAQWIEVCNARELAKREHQRARAIGPYKGNWPDAEFRRRSR